MSNSRSFPIVFDNTAFFAAKTEVDYMSDLRKQLLARYLSEDPEPPSWAKNCWAPIPLVGRQFRGDSSVLVYASAEHLEWLDNPEERDKALYEGKAGMDRHRAMLTRNGIPPGKYFPKVGISPVSSGALLCAAHFVTLKIGRLPIAGEEPAAFLENICVANWCKFTLKANSKDYPDDLNKLSNSLRFVIADLELLRPRVVLLPSRIWRHSTVSVAMQRAAPATLFVPVPQFLPAVVNRHLAAWEDAARSLERSHRQTALGSWMKKLAGLNHHNAWRYVAWLDDVLRPYGQPQDNHGRGRD